MKLTKGKILVALVAFNFALWGMNANANINCGIKPIKPLGCGQNAYATCQCDSQGNCRWVWVNC